MNRMGRRGLLRRISELSNGWTGSGGPKAGPLECCDMSQLSIRRPVRPRWGSARRRRFPSPR
jgi:hypothetical protein